MQTFKLEQQSWTDVESYLKSDNRIILPVGSTEQHGTFAPLGTDTYVAKAIALGAQLAGIAGDFLRAADEASVAGVVELAETITDEFHVIVGGIKNGVKINQRKTVHGEII